MTTRFTSTSVIFNDSTAQVSASPTRDGNNAASGNGALFIDRTGNNLRFKNITHSNTGLWTVRSAARSIGSVEILYNPGMGGPVFDPVGSK
jgi:hypothetical protein